MFIFIFLLTFWSLICLGIWYWKRELFRRTWAEPYLADQALLIESDDWGPGAPEHAQRLEMLDQTLQQHRDSLGRHPILTANIVLAIPDFAGISRNHYTGYYRRLLDEDFPEITQQLRCSIFSGTLVPQLHGMEHCNGNALTQLAATQDERVQNLVSEEDWSDWEVLDSPLQGHFVDGTHLPTRELSLPEQQEVIALAMRTFQRIFGHPSLSAVAPCYLWNDVTEQLWADSGVRFIQTAGYRCTGRDAKGKYQQDPPLLRIGEKNTFGQYYLVRNAMYEPADGHNADTCLREIHQAVRQAAPIIISTHRYNFTGSKALCDTALAGLNHILSETEHAYPRLRYLSSPELGAWIAGEPTPLTCPFSGTTWPDLQPALGLKKLRGFLFRLWYRHPKLRLAAIMTGLVLPLGLAAISTAP